MNKEEEAMHDEEGQKYFLKACCASAVADGEGYRSPHVVCDAIHGAKKLVSL